MKRKLLACTLAGLMAVSAISPVMAAPAEPSSDSVQFASEEHPVELDFSDSLPVGDVILDEQGQEIGIHMADGSYVALAESAEEADLSDNPEENAEADSSEGPETDSVETRETDSSEDPETESKADVEAAEEISEEVTQEAAYSTEISGPDDEIALMQSISDQIRENLLAGKTSFDIPVYGASILAPWDTCTQMRQISYYCPYIDGSSIKASTYTTTRNVVKYIYSISINCSLSAADAVQWVNRIDGKLGELMDLLDTTSGQGSDEFDEALTLHDFMASHYEYDTSYAIHHPSGMLTQGKGVCQAYAMLFQYIMNQRGYTCYMTSSASMNHAWNLLELDGTFYNLDVTWDDPLIDRFGLAGHEYFLFSDADSSHAGRDLTDIVCDADYPILGGMDKTALDSPVLAEPEGYYYVDSKGLNLYSGDSSSVIDAFSNRWPTMEGNGYWGGCYSGLDKYGNVLYYNSATDLRYYNLSGSNSGVFAGVSDETGYCYGSRVEDGTIWYVLKESPLGETYLEYGRDLPEKAHTHRFDGAAFVWSEDYSEATAQCTCTVCGETVEYPATVTSERNEPDCFTNGLITYTATAKINKKTYSDAVGVYLDRLEHDYGEGEIIKEATPEEPGSIRYECGRCGYIVYESLEYQPKPCSIIRQPETVSAGVKQTVSFHIEAENAASYQWQYSKNEGKKWINCSATGNTTDTITLKVTDSNSVNIYRCIVTGFEGEKVISESAGVDVLPGVVIVMSPRSNAVAVGEYATFTVEAENAASYQWQYSKDGANWYRSSADGNKTDTLLVKGEQKSQGNRYRCVVTGIDGNTKKSYMAAMIVMTVAPKACQAQVGETASYTLKAEGIAAYQWQYSKDGGQSWYRSNAAGADTDTVTFTASKSNRTMIYRCKLTTPDEATAFTKPVGFVN